MSDDAKPHHPAVEGPESPLEAVREQAHEPAGLQERFALLEDRERRLEAREKELESKLARVEEERVSKERDLVERMQRLQADFENFRRRAREDAAAAQGRGKEALLRAMLPVLDGLDRALTHVQDEGLQLVARNLVGILEREGISILAPAPGDGFDARAHEALAQEAREGAKPGTVLSVLEKGYTIDGRVVRPARVVVAA